MIVKRCSLLAVCVILVLAILLPSCTQKSTTTPTEQRPQDVELNLVGFIAGTSQQLKTDAIAEAEEGDEQYQRQLEKELKEFTGRGFR